MLLKKYNNEIIVAEGFIIFVLFTILLALGGAILSSSFPDIPKKSIYVLTSGILCPILTILYLWFRTKYIPQLTLNRDTILYSIAGITFIWLYLYICLFIFGFNNKLVNQLTNYHGFYKYLNIFWLIIWSPITEEIIFRGYFLKLLSHKKTITALLITSVLFVALHIIFNNYAFDSTMLVSATSFFLFSMTVGFIYMQAGLIPAILIHVFSNYYFLMAVT